MPSTPSTYGGSSPFNPGEWRYMCVPKKLSSTHVKNINGVSRRYNWCLDRSSDYSTSSSSHTCTTAVTQSGSIMSVGYDTGYARYKVTGGSYARYSSTIAPYCVNVASGDSIVWTAPAYSGSNKLCFSPYNCPLSTTKPYTSNSWFASSWFYWMPTVIIFWIVCGCITYVRHRRRAMMRMNRMRRNINAVTMVTTTTVETGPTAVVATAQPPVGAYVAAPYPVATATPHAMPQAIAVAQPAVAQAVAHPVGVGVPPVAVATAVPMGGQPQMAVPTQAEYAL